MTELERYSKITTVMPREFILLQGKGCKWKKCTFCDYYLDASSEPFLVNEEVLDKVTGEFGVLDVINSGSCLELDDKTIEKIREVCEKKGIHTLWFEAHWLYHNKLADFSKHFPKQNVNFRCGIETFSAERRNIWEKGVPSNVTAEDVAKYYKGICLLVGVKGQTKEEILENLRLAKEYFPYYSVNLFVNNSTKEKRDPELAKWFINEIAPALQNEKERFVEVLIDNTDLGVG